MGKEHSQQEAKRAHPNAQAIAKLKRFEKRKHAVQNTHVSRNGVESAGVHTPPVLFQSLTPPAAFPRVYTQGEMSGREDTEEDAGRSQSPPAP
eukprot:scaffold312409_cov17-Tisochrysis_lutea.AAC.1